MGSDIAAVLVAARWTLTTQPIRYREQTVVKRLEIEKAPAGRLDDVHWFPLPSHLDQRGVLTVLESGVDLPFEIRRVYFLHHIRDDRGAHAHRDTNQLIIALTGHCQLILSDGDESRTYILDDPTRGLLLGPMLFIRMQNFSPNAVIGVLASTHYDKTRSIYSWEEYLEVIRK